MGDAELPSVNPESSIAPGRGLILCSPPLEKAQPLPILSLEPNGLW